MSIAHCALEEIDSVMKAQANDEDLGQCSRVLGEKSRDRLRRN